MIIFLFYRVTELTSPSSSSIKANIDHLGGDSGLVSILKSIMILESGIMSPNPLFEKLDTKINAKF